METTSLQTLEINIHEKYVSIVRKFIKSLGGTVKLRKKNGLDEALEDIKAGRVYHADSTKDMLKQILK